MTTTQMTSATAHAVRPRYEKLLADRILWGRLMSDHLSHLREATPQALRVFRALLAADATLAGYRRYDRDLFSRVLPAEDARIHWPPTPPVDHASQPCSLCLHAALELDVNVMLTAQSRRTR
jgi:hypothetical protein